MNKKYILLVVIIASSCTSTLFSYRTRFLHDERFTGTQEQVFGGVCDMAEQLEFEQEREKVCLEKKRQRKLARALKIKQEKMAMLQQKKEEKMRQKELARLTRLERKKMKEEERCEAALLRKAATLEKKRRKRITAWRDYRSKKKAAKSLIRQAYAVDVGNRLHMKELQGEVRVFAQERLRGRVEEYPELEGFLEL